MVQVVQRVETHREDLAGGVEMPEIGAREAAADRTSAGLVHRAGVVGELAPLDLQAPGRGEQSPVPGVPRRKDAVEQVAPERHHLDEVGGCPHSHQVARLILGEPRRRQRHNRAAPLRRLSHRDTADGVPLEAQGGDLLDAALPQLAIVATLYDAELRPPVPRERVAAAPGPQGRPAHGLEEALQARRKRRAVVERHDDVASKRVLDRQAALRSHRQKRPVEVGAERDAVVRDCTPIGETQHLEPPAVGEDRTLPSHEAVQAAEAADEVLPRAQRQMVGIAENQLETEGGEVLRRHRLDRARGADGHERGCFDLAVLCCHPAPPRAGPRIAL